MSYPPKISWQDYSDLDFHITEEEVQHLGGVKDAVKLPDGEYLANLNVHHELHCLVRSIFKAHIHKLLIIPDENSMESLPRILLSQRNPRDASPDSRT
jgi:hypothetical protein